MFRIFLINDYAAGNPYFLILILPFLIIEISGCFSKIKSKGSIKFLASHLISVYVIYYLNWTILEIYCCKIFPTLVYCCYPN